MYTQLERKSVSLTALVIRLTALIPAIHKAQAVKDFIEIRVARSLFCNRSQTVLPPSNRSPPTHLAAPVKFFWHIMYFFN